MSVAESTRVEARARRHPDALPQTHRCPNIDCRGRRAAADVIERDVLAEVARAILPDSVIEAAKRELRRRLETPEVASVGQRWARLEKRLEQLKNLYAWGDLSDAAYQAERDAVRAQLAELPADDRIASFDAYRTKLLGLAEAIDLASPARLEELCGC